MRLGRVYAVQVYFCTKLGCPAAATRSQERLVGKRLSREPCVRQLIFVSKGEALAMIKKEDPTLYQAMPPGVGNPLPDSFEVMLEKPSCAPAIAASARAAHWHGVQKVDLKRRPPTRVGS